MSFNSPFLDKKFHFKIVYRIIISDINTLIELKMKMKNIGKYLSSYVA